MLRWLGAFALLLPGSIAAQPREAIRYTLRFPDAQSHYVEVEARLPPAPGAARTVMMPVWTPGSYLVREYARSVDALAAESQGRPARVAKTAKNRWRVESGPGAVTLRYRVYCRVMSVQDCFVDRDFAVLNGAAVFITLADESLPRPHEVRLELPPAWKTAVSGMPSTGPTAFLAGDYDRLVDSPILAGNPAIHEFEVAGKKHYLVNEGEGGVWDGPRSAADVKKIVEEYYRMWGVLPYEKYLFLNVIQEGGGGLEHQDSTLMMASRWATRTRERYLRWLELASHEYFHTWNVKRLRPVELGPFDYEKENYSRSLWIAEGLTSYYDSLALHRAGLSARNEYLDALSREISALQTTPGRLVQPVEDSSFDTWIKAYRRNENSPNTGISYYTKGAVAGFVLDARIRTATGGMRSLDDLMRLVYEKYSGARGFTPEEFRQAASTIAGTDLSAWFEKVLETTGEIDYKEALDWYGLRFKPEDPARAEKAWTGLVTRLEGGRLVVAEVRRGTPGYEAGFNAGDEIIAIGDYRMPPDQWETRMQYFRPNEKASILVARRERLLRLETTFAREPGNPWRLELDPQATPDQRARLTAWLRR
ncbi:MAG TPA: peptidase M61 [Solibacterales bacterium]|nr:peptidase M61 [Bryobacterales bacterium]